MSLSINNSPFVKVDTSPMERPVLPATATGVNQTASSHHSAGVHVPVRNDNAKGGQNEVIFNSGAFTKLFDMLELVFKTMREMFAGKNITPDVLPDAERSPKVKPDAGPQPKVKPDAGPQPMVKPDAGPQPMVKPDAGRLRPVLPGPTVPVLPAVPKPVVNVTNDANAQVKVEVNVNHCHCPDTKSEHDKGLRPRVAPDVSVTPQPAPTVVPQTDTKPSVPPKPDTTPKPGVTPQPAPTVVPQTDTKPSVPPKADATPKPGVMPQPQPQVIPDNDAKPTVNPDRPQPLPDLTSPAPGNDRGERNRPGVNHRTWLRT